MSVGGIWDQVRRAPPHRARRAAPPPPPPTRRRRATADAPPRRPAPPPPPPPRSSSARSAAPRATTPTTTSTSPAARARPSRSRAARPAPRASASTAKTLSSARRAGSSSAPRTSAPAPRARPTAAYPASSTATRTRGRGATPRRSCASDNIQQFRPRRRCSPSLTHSARTHLHPPRRRPSTHLRSWHLLPRGVTVFALDFAGSGRSEGAWVSLGAHEVGDLAAAVAYLRAEGSVSTLALWGRSMGAVTALLYAATDPGASVEVLVIVACVSYNFRSAARSKPPALRPQALPASSPTRLSRASPT